MKIIETKEAYMDEIAEIYIGNWKGVYKGLLPKELLDSLTLELMMEKWKTYLGMKDHKIFCARENDTILGFAACMPDWEWKDCLYLDALHVKSEARGRGIGSQLIKWTVRSARERGYTRMSICIVKGNDIARNLYLKLGAEHVKDFVDDLYGSRSNSEKLVWRDLSLLDF